MGDLTRCRFARSLPAKQHTRALVQGVRGGLALLVGPAAADAKPPLGSPRVVRATIPADHVGRAIARTEWWRLRGVNRSSGAWFELYLLRDGGLWGSSLTVVDGAGHERRGELGLDTVHAGRDRLVGRGAGSLTVRRVGSGFRVALDDPEATATLRLRTARRGPAALGWRMKPRPAGGTRVDGMSWAVPVATSVLSGRFTIRGTPVRVDGWRRPTSTAGAASTSRALRGSAGTSTSSTAPAGPPGSCTASTGATRSNRQAARTGRGWACSPASAHVACAHATRASRAATGG